MKVSHTSYGSRRHSEADADSLAYACHIHDDKHHKYGKQTGSEDKQVLRPESLELHFTAHTFYLFQNQPLSYCCFSFLEEERPQNGSGDYQERYRLEPLLAVFEVSGIARTELLVDLDPSHESDHSSHAYTNFVPGSKYDVTIWVASVIPAEPLPWAIAALAAATAASIIINLFFFINSVIFK